MFLTLFSVAGGVAFTLIAVRDVFLTLFAPTSRGVLTPAITRTIWRTMQPLWRGQRKYRELAGPLIFITILVVWAAMIALGFALIYWTFLPEHFLVDFGTDAQRDKTHAFFSSLYFSMVVLATLGFGDIAPTGTLLRMIVPIESLVGLGLLTAGISYFLSIDPVLSRRRVLAHQIAVVREAERTIHHRWDSETSSELFNHFANELIAINSDQLQLPITYYFRSADRSAELAMHLPYLLELVQRERDQSLQLAKRGDIPAHAYISQHLLERAITDYVIAVNKTFLRNDPDNLDEAMRAFIADHTNCGAGCD